MVDHIDRAIFDHLVELAALELNEGESEYILRELNHQLRAIRELEAIQLESDLPATSHGIAYTGSISQPLRQDVWQPFEHPEKIMSQVPQVDENYIVAPDIPHSALE